MLGSPNIARIGALCGDTTRATMLSALMGGKALTAGELAQLAGIGLPTASGHLAKLVDGGLVVVRAEGRHRYFGLSGEPVASLLESMMGLAAADQAVLPQTGPRDNALRTARSCYNHLAGEKGVQLFESMLEKNQISRVDNTLSLTRKGREFLIDLGIDVDALQCSRSPLCKVCLDWSERQSHLAGSVGRALLTHFEESAWIKRQEGTRVLIFSRKGSTAFEQYFGN